nr:MauE/DoxX family redox-associated membrane protein [uncultured Desulfuromonas sp.]
MKQPLLLAVRLMVAGVFLYAGSQKVLDPLSFAEAIGRYQLVPVWGNLLLASVLPMLEIVVAIALLLPRWWRAASLLSIALNTVFSVALLSAMIRGLSIDCGCFGGTVGLWSSLAAALLRATGLLGMSLYLFLSEESCRE